MNEIDAIVSLWGKDCLLDEDGTLTIEGRVPTSQELSEIQDEIIRLQAEFDAQEYGRLRESEYPSWQDQLDDIFHNGLESWKTSIQTVKDKYPKG